MGTTSNLQMVMKFDSILPLLSPDEIYEQACQSLLEQLKEDRRIERKPSGTHSRVLGEYFSMWANTVPEGGLMVMGINNDSTVSGCLNLSQDQLNELERAGNIHCPDAHFQTKRIGVRRPDGVDDFLVIIRIFYRTDKVVRTTQGDAFVRMGESKIKLSEETIRELEHDKGQIDLEREPVQLYYPTNFDYELIRQFTVGYRTKRELSDSLTDEEILEHRHLGKRDNLQFNPNTACALLFANDPLTLFPGCKIRFLRFDGEHEGTGENFNAVKDIWIEGPVPKLIVEIEKVLDSHLRSFTRLGKDGKFYTAPEYPKTAWYEAIVNACVHRSYGLRNMNIFVKMFDDRLVVESPGGFPPLVTSENIFDMHNPRNPCLMEAMFYMRYVKCANEGTRRIRDKMAEEHLPPPEFAQKGTGNVVVRVTLRNNIKQRKVWIDADAAEVIGDVIFKTLTNHEKRVINFVAENKTINVSQVQRLCDGLTWPASKKLLDKLVVKGILEHKKKKIGHEPSARYVLKSPSHES